MVSIYYKPPVLPRHPPHAPHRPHGPQGQQQGQHYGCGHYAGSPQEQARAQLDSKTYASMLNGLTSTQLAQEKKSIEHQMKHLPPCSSEYKAFQQKLDLIGKEQKSRPNGWFNSMLDNNSRQNVQNQYANKSTASLQSELQKLYQQRDNSLLARIGIEKSNYGKDSELQKKIGAIEAELTKRGVLPGQTLPLPQPQPKPPPPAQPQPQPPVWLPDLPPGSPFGIGTKPPVQAPPPVVAQPPPPPPFTYKDTVRVLSNNFNTIKNASGNSDRFIREADLRAIVNNPSKYSADVVKAARFLLDNKGFLNMLDTGTKPGGKPDGKISLEDVTAEFRRNG